VIESINGFLKTFKALDETTNKSLPHLIKDYKIAAALINIFYQRLFSDGENSIEMAKSMKAVLNKPNKLERIINKSKLYNITASYEELNPNLINDFSKVEITMISKIITFGNYHLEQSISYLA
jgi:hypothetical protein